MADLLNENLKLLDFKEPALLAFASISFLQAIKNTTISLHLLHLVQYLSLLWQWLDFSVEIVFVNLLFLQC